jgi:hypothetical protein
VRAVPVQDGEQGLIEFEWLGDPSTSLIGEPAPRTRGSNATSLDAAVAFVDRLGRKHLVLLEWKYTEQYPGSEEVKAGKFDGDGPGATRRKRYGALFEADEGPVDASLVSLEELGYEPFYQFLRQQLLAAALTGNAEPVRLLHIAPRANTDFALVTPERLRAAHPGDSATAVWRGLLRDPSAFVSVHTEDVFRPLLAQPPQGMAAWARYIAERYAFVRAA